MSKEKNTKICTYDVMCNKTHKISSVYKYFQQIATEDLDAVGLTYDSLLKKGIVFVLVKMRSVFYSPLRTGDETVLSTCHRKVKGASFIRDYVITRNGEKVAETSSYWVLMDINTRRLCRPSVFEDNLRELTELCSFEINDRFAFPDDCDTSEYLYNVVFSDIDENGHMNNTRYPDICLDAIGSVIADKYVSEVRIDYLAEAKLGEELSLCFTTEPQDGVYYFYAKNLTSDNKCFDASIKVLPLENSVD